MKKKAIAAITALAMCSSVLPVTAAAEEEQPEMTEEPIAEIEEEPICEEETVPQDETQESVTEDISDSELEDIPDAEEPDDPAPELGKLFAVTYVDENGTEQIAHNVKSLADTLYTTTTLTSGWYVVWWDITAKERIEIKGDVNLILCDGYTLTTQRGIHNGGQNSLTIWGQKNGTGLLYSERPHFDGQAAIGGNDEEDGGRFEVHGGNVTVERTGYNAAGIGGGHMGSGGNIVIYNGNVKVMKSDDTDGGGAGIGSGSANKGGHIWIYGGTVEAYGNHDGSLAGAGIGSGGGSTSVGIIDIYGGKVRATGGGGSGLIAGAGAGIGGGTDGSNGEIRIYGGDIVATSPYVWGFLHDAQGAGFGGGNFGYNVRIEVWGGRAEGHGYQAFGCGRGRSDSGTLVLGNNIWAGECDNIFPYNQRYEKARIPEVYLIER